MKFWRSSFCDRSNIFKALKTMVLKTWIFLFLYIYLSKKHCIRVFACFIYDTEVFSVPFLNIFVVKSRSILFADLGWGCLGGYLPETKATEFPAMAGEWRCCKQAGVLSLAVARPGGCRAAGNGRRPGGRPAIDPTVAGGPVSRVQGHRSPVLGAPKQWVIS